MIPVRHHLPADTEPEDQRDRVVPAKLPLQMGQHVPEFVLRTGVIAAHGHLTGNAEPGGQRVRVVWAQPSLQVGRHSSECILGPV
jgi:hypothetical protein